jgi:hypothetical protein
MVDQTVSALTDIEHLIATQRGLLPRNTAAQDISAFGDSYYSSLQPSIDNVTAIVKTFKRYHLCQRLLDSASLYYPALKFIIVDDSEQIPVLRLSSSSRLYHVGFDKGLSYGRNFALTKVKTPFFLLLDDDFVFTASTKLESMLDILTSKPVDILGGMVDINGVPMNYFSNFHVEHDYLVQNPVNEGEQGPTYCDIVLNFFMARTAAVRAVGGWNARLKLAEHTEFFMRAKSAGLRTAYSECCRIEHQQERFGDYADYRRRGVFFTEIMLRLCQLQGIVNVHGEAYHKRGITNSEWALNRKMLYHREPEADAILQAISHASQLAGLRIFLSNGTLLGRIRENGYLGHDSDLDFGLLAEDFTPSLTEAFESAGLSVERVYGSPANGHELVLRLGELKADIFLYYKEGNQRVMSVWDEGRQIKMRFPDFSLVKDTFRGCPLWIPDDCDNYLETAYGEGWRIPVPQWDWRTSPRNLDS